MPKPTCESILTDASSVYMITSEAGFEVSSIMFTHNIVFTIYMCTKEVYQSTVSYIPEVHTRSKGTLACCHAEINCTKVRDLITVVINCPANKVRLIKNIYDCKLKCNIKQASSERQ